MLPIHSLLSLCLFAVYANAHTYVWSVWVNGVDQGTGNGVRLPAYNGPMSDGGYANSPVRDLTMPEMACNVMGEIPNNATIQAAPGDVVTLEWHHNFRNSSDDIIDASHKGSGLVYISSDPPVGDSWLKIQEEGQDANGTWYSGGKLNSRQGKQDVQIPDNLVPGFYLLRGELLALHEADVAHINNTNRGIQIYISCIQLEIVGNGTLQLPEGVPFPGAYQYTDPGIVFNIYLAETAPYTIPGPPVWTAAAPSPTVTSYGDPKGYTTAQPWNTWIGDGFSTVTAATSVTVGQGSATQVHTYAANWPTTYVAPSVGIASAASRFGSFNPAATVTTLPAEATTLPPTPPS